MDRFVFIHGVTRFRIIRSYYKGLWGIKSYAQSTNKVFGGNIYGSWNMIRGIAGYLIRAGTIINGNRRDIQSWATTMIWKGIIESVIKCTVVLLSC